MTLTRLRAAPRTSQVVANELRDALLTGRFGPGQRLKEEDLARELGVSRTPVREAMLILQNEGLLEAEPNRGMAVRSYALDDLDGHYRLRALLEGYAARLAASNIDADAIAALKESCDRFGDLRNSDDVLGLVRENSFFHDAIHVASKDARLVQIIKSISALPFIYRSYYWYGRDYRAIIEHYHRQLVCALEQGDSERAEIVMKEHILEARDILIKNWRSLSRRS
jgi:DNA-binding GntR family transcriptional regulator